MTGLLLLLAGYAVLAALFALAALVCTLLIALAEAGLRLLWDIAWTGRRLNRSQETATGGEEAAA